ARAWATSLSRDRTSEMKAFISDATALAMARQRALTGRDPAAVDDERVLLARTVAARQALFSV
ncbi:MAG: PrsW family intramembrane metalloprotease, partial [Microbacterium sp.]|nr:PrsW family intramembrane metalloprotease [Microbacterium sp.]